MKDEIHDSHDMIDGEMVGEEHLLKEVVLYYVIVSVKTVRGDVIVYHRPVCIIGAFDDDSCTIYDNETIIGIIPAPSGTYRVSGEDINGVLIELGCVIPGEDPVDWVDRLKRYREEQYQYHSNRKQREAVES